MSLNVGRIHLCKLVVRSMAVILIQKKAVETSTFGFFYIDEIRSIADQKVNL